jgi:VWFA-related protein
MIPAGRARALVLLAALAAPAVAAWQEPPPAVFGVDVRLVAVPVFVTDKDGHAVAGLTAQDFEVEDGGRSVPLTGFLAVDAGAPAAALPDAGTSPRLLAASRRQFLLLFDLTFSSTSGMLKSRQAALDLLEKGTQPGDLVSVASFGPAGLNVRVGFTPDRSQAARAVATLGSVEGTRLRDPLELAYDLGFNPNEREALSEDDRDRALQLGGVERAEYRQRVLSYVGELQRLAQLLDSVQGRKQVILLSGGFDQSVLMGAEGTEQAASAQAVTEGRLWEVKGDRYFGDSQARSTMDALFQALTRSDTVIHTVNVAGLSAAASVEDRQTSPTGSGRGTLAELANRSGGRFIQERNDLAGALGEVLDASRYFYVLAFEPGDSRKKPGEPHAIKVKARRPGLEVSHRAAYTLPDPKAATPLTTRVQAAEVIAKGLTGGALRLRAVAVPYRAKGASFLPLVLEIEGESLLQGAGKKPLPLEVYGYALDGDGRVQDAFALLPTLDLEKLGVAVRQKGVQVITSFRAREGTADLRFLVREPGSGRAGSLRLMTLVPSFAPGALVVSPPLLMDDPRARLVIAAPSKANPELEIPFRLEDTAFTPQAAPVLRNGEAREVCLMAFGGNGGAATVKAALVREDGQLLALEAGPPRLVQDADRFQRVVVSLTPRDVPPGDYRLRVTLQDAPQGTALSELPVRVN